MKNFILFSLLLAVAFPVHSQDGAAWNIFHNKKKIFSASEENEQKNIIIVTSADFKPNKNFIISYSEMNRGRSAKEWRRTIGIYNEADKELIRKDTAALKLSDAQVKKMLLQNKIIRIYTWSLPKDPKEAARVRIRRVHLCTIMLK